MSTTLATDMFYYIMDYSSNYYRVDSSDQLVASDMTEATVFSFVDANKRIGSGPKSRFYFMTPINDENKVEEELLQEETAENIELTDTIVPAAKELTAGKLIEEVEKSISEYDIQKVDWLEYLTHFSYIVAGLKEYRESLIKAESDADRKICDVLHYIELCNTDEEEAANLVELLRVCRENRRVVKDEIFKVEMFQKNVGTSANVAKAKEAIKSIKGLETRKYTPRKLTELFEGSEIKIKDGSYKKAELRTYEPSNSVEEYALEEDGIMDLERKETAFDGKQNDWMAFAMQQAEFYKNAGQYITNLRIDIGDIDDAIADLMDEVESANCNVTQGYKMFKRLKELRIERKEKEKELECLIMLTEHFDLCAMADECENNVVTMSQYLYGDMEDNQSEGELCESEVLEA